jgi:hypothetical protein
MVQGWGLTSTKVPAVFDDTNRYGRTGLQDRALEVFFGLPLVSFPGVAFGTNPSLSTISKPRPEFQAVSNLPLHRVAASGRANSNRRLFAC